MATASMEPNVTMTQRVFGELSFLRGQCGLSSWSTPSILHSHTMFDTCTTSDALC